MNQWEVIKRLYKGRKKSAQVSPARLSPAEELIYAQLRDTGIAVISSHYSPEQVAQLRDLLDTQLDSVTEAQWIDVADKVKLPGNKFGISLGNPWKFWSDGNFSDQRIIGAEMMHPIIEAFGNDQSFINIGNTYLERSVNLRFCMANRTSFVPNNMGSGGGWHRDMNYKKGFKALLYLVDVDPGNGCFQYLPRSSSVFHHLVKTPVPDKYQFSHEEVLGMTGHDEGKIMNVTGKAGTVVLFDTNGIHRGKPIEQGRRYAITNYYSDH